MTKLAPELGMEFQPQEKAYAYKPVIERLVDRAGIAADVFCTDWQTLVVRFPESDVFSETEFLQSREAYSRCSAILEGLIAELELPLKAMWCGGIPERCDV